eukprot:CAMPEP_0168221176 /NCGR_PEP_ID=MMETSP0140_2-20121125/9741_1 /TAXON_ID=44445 /ORGANISM="Pseudo-nitzschia australis, Strain 10249 10 AB" /LENGTH=404 /DNA_ID=CAMNT_0008150181 /DNA_START=388 /DNA_END=1606 /DNA_ORIENTATION=+
MARGFGFSKDVVDLSSFDVSRDVLDGSYIARNGSGGFSGGHFLRHPIGARNLGAFVGRAERQASRRGGPQVGAVQRLAAGQTKMRSPHEPASVRQRDPKRRDAAGESRAGGPVEPVPLKEVDEGVLQLVLDEALDSAAYETLNDSNNNSLDRSALKGVVDMTRDRLEPVFARAVSSSNDGKSTSSSSDASTLDEAKKRQRYNLEVFARVRAYGDALAKTTPQTSSSSTATSTKPQSTASYIRQSGRKIDLVWGRNLLEKLAGPSSAGYEFQSPFPKPDPDIPLPYDADQLTNALGAIEKALNKLQQGGLIGHWEISIPEDDYGEVVTIAVDDDVCLGAQILAREENSSLTGSPVVAMVRSALEERAKIPYTALDVFFIDPTTTKNELYNPTQLLVSLRNLGEEP